MNQIIIQTKCFSEGSTKPDGGGKLDGHKQKENHKINVRTIWTHCRTPFSSNDGEECSLDFNDAAAH